MGQFEFDEILKKYLAGKASPEEEKLIFRWYKSFISESKIEISTQEKKAIEAKIWGKLKDKMSRNPKIIRRASKPIIYRLWFKYVAACLFLLIALKGLWVYRNTTRSVIAAEAFTHIQVPPTYQFVFNNKNGDIPVKLADGSTVELQPQSTLYYPPKFTGTTRNVYLTGNAFFKITHDPAHHFIVHTDEGLLAEVLGTSFYVLHYKNHDKVNRVEVNVVTGKVYVYKQEKTIAAKKSSSKKILLTPNQQAKFSPQNHQFVISLVDNPKPIQGDEEYVAPPEAAFTYKDAPLSKILNDIGGTYGISIKVDNSKLNDSHFTGDISGQSLYDKLNIVCEATQSSYEVKGTTIYIKGEGGN
ncbi:FecR family protein [Arachidicoccus sp.]|uniref:FecR family protein n=1 Tax=Arachidicoccus sp. TaxID=1872624 RepID=UPI003D193128